jgi:hypothetical protein
MYRQIHTHTCALGTGFKLVLFKVQYEMLETQHLMHKGFETNYSSCTGRSSENICNTGQGAQENGKEGMKLSLPAK